MNMICRLLLSLVAALAGGDALAATFCVGTGDELRNALNTASSNGQNDVIRMRQGTYSATMNAVAFAYSFSEPNALILEGGWLAGGGPGTCLSRVEDPTLTILDGSNTRRVLNVYGFPGGGDVTLRNFTVRNGFSTTDPGGVEVGGGAGYAGNVVVERLLIHSNTGFIVAGIDGGSDGGTFKLVNNVIRDNVCSDNYCAASITVNDAAGSAQVRAEIIGNTIVDNVSTTPGGFDGLRIGGSALARVANNIIVGHAGADLRTDGTHQLLHNNLLVQSGMPAAISAGNLSIANPGFVDWNGDDLRLAADSPMIERGASGLPLPLVDFAGVPRLNNVRYDIGAYESQFGVFSDGFE